MRAYEIQNVIEGAPAAVLAAAVSLCCAEGVIALGKRYGKKVTRVVLGYLAFGLLAAITLLFEIRTHPDPARIAVTHVAALGYLLSLPYILARLLSIGPRSELRSLPFQIVLILLAFALPYGACSVAEKTTDGLYASEQMLIADSIMAAVFVLTPPLLLAVSLRAVAKLPHAGQ